MRKLHALLAALLLTTAVFSQQKNPRLGNASREDRNGWIYIHLEGSPKDIGFQHGYLLSAEIDDLIRAMKLVLPHESGKDWGFYKDFVKKAFWAKVDPEYQEEITGISEGLKAKGKGYDVYDLVV